MEKATNVPISDIAHWAEEALRVLSLFKGQAFAGVPTCFPQIDENIRGLVRGATTFVGGAPGMGKTSFLTNLALRNVGLLQFQTITPQRQRILMISAEMGEILWVQRVISMILGVPQGMLALGEQGDKMRWNGEDMVKLPPDADISEEIASIAAFVKRLPIELMGGGVVSTFTIEQKLHELVVEKRLDVPLVILDHAGMLADVGESEGGVARPDFICQRLDYLAQTYFTHIVSVWPLTKAGLQGKKIPSYNALRGSVMPSYQAANVLILHSPRLAELLMAERIFVTERVPVQVSIQKNRFFGRYEVVELPFIPTIGRFDDRFTDIWLNRYREYMCPVVPAPINNRGSDAGTPGDMETSAVNLARKAEGLFE